MSLRAHIDQSACSAHGDCVDVAPQIFTSLETAQRMGAGRPVVNDVVMRLDEGADPVAIRTQLESALDTAGWPAR